MLCPKCGRDVGVYRTTEKDGVPRQQRNCLCGHTFFTRIVYEDNVAIVIEHILKE